MSIVANICRALPPLANSSHFTRSANDGESSQDAFTKISSVMDIVIRLVGYSDQKVVESAAKAVSRIICFLLM